MFTQIRCQLATPWIGMWFTLSCVKNLFIRNDSADALFTYDDIHGHSVGELEACLFFQIQFQSLNRSLSFLM